MEFFVWCWIWDKRVLFGLNHGRTVFVYLWLIPILVSVGLLPYALYEQLMKTNDTPAECDKIALVKENGDRLRISIYVEEALLCLQILTSLGMIIKTKSVIKRLILRQKGSINFYSAAPEFDYSWQVRDLSLKSCIGYLTLLTGMINFACSIVYIYFYWAYTEAV